MNTHLTDSQMIWKAPHGGMPGLIGDRPHRIKGNINEDINEDTIPKPGGLGARELGRSLTRSDFVRLLFGHFPSNVRCVRLAQRSDFIEQERSNAQ
jgi:hypothetical protein